MDTSKDPRILVAERALKMLKRILEHPKYIQRRERTEALEHLKEVERELMILKYSYMDKRDLINSEDMKKLKEAVMKVYKALGGEKFEDLVMRNAKKEEREKARELISKIKFCLNVLYNLDWRIAMGKDGEIAHGVDIRVGKVLSVAKHPNADSLLVCNVDLGGKAITVVTNDLSVKEGDKVAVALLPPKNLRGIVSEGMFLGAGEGVLKKVQGKPGEWARVPEEALAEARNFVNEFLSSRTGL